MRPASGLPGLAEARERDLLGRLGLDERATAEDVMRTHGELQAFLATAPRSLRTWARGQASIADEAFVLLSDPTAWRGAGALPAQPTQSEPSPGGPATPPARRVLEAPPAADPADLAPTAPGDATDDDDFEAMLAEVTPSMHRDRVAPRRPDPSRARAAGATRSAVAVSRGGRLIRLPGRLAAVAGLVAVVAVSIIVYQAGAAPASPGPTGSPGPAATAALDEALVASLMTRIQANAKDTDALLQLGDAFFQAGEYSVAATWLEKLIALEPGNVRGRLALGAARFNLGDFAAAESEWLEALKADPSNVEGHYDLGFLYLNENPSDMDGVRREWGEVIRLAPNSDIATVVQQHLDALASASPAASAGPSSGPTGAPPAAPSADASIAPSAPSAAPSQTIGP